MRKTLFFCNLVSSTVMLTMAFVMWLAPESFAMATSHFHVLMTVVGTMGMTWSVLEMRDMHHADDLFENSEVVESNHWGFGPFDASYVLVGGRGVGGRCLVFHHTLKP
jgi:hypothetical protein